MSLTAWPSVNTTLPGSHRTGTTAVVFVLAEPRIRMATDTTSGVALRGEGFYVSALLGAVVTVVTSFVPVAPAFGGAVAGYLHDSGTDRGTRVGAVSGAFASLPLAALYLFILGIFVFGSITTGEVAGPAFVAVLVGGIFLVIVLYTVGLSALGGYVGGRYAESRAAKRDRATDARDEHSGIDPDQTTLDDTGTDETSTDTGRPDSVGDSVEGTDRDR